MVEGIWVLAQFFGGLVLVLAGFICTCFLLLVSLGIIWASLTGRKARRLRKDRKREKAEEMDWWTHR